MCLLTLKNLIELLLLGHTGEQAWHTPNCSPSGPLQHGGFIHVTPKLMAWMKMPSLAGSALA